MTDNTGQCSPQYGGDLLVEATKLPLAGKDRASSPRGIQVSASHFSILETTGSIIPKVVALQQVVDEKALLCC